MRKFYLILLFASLTSLNFAQTPLSSPSPPMQGRGPINSFTAGGEQQTTIIDANGNLKVVPKSAHIAQPLPTVRTTPATPAVSAQALGPSHFGAGQTTPGMNQAAPPTQAASPVLPAQGPTVPNMAPTPPLTPAPPAPGTTNVTAPMQPPTPVRPATTLGPANPIGPRGLVTPAPSGAGTQPGTAPVAGAAATPGP